MKQQTRRAWVKENYSCHGIQEAEREGTAERDISFKVTPPATSPQQSSEGESAVVSAHGMMFPKVLPMNA